MANKEVLKAELKELFEKMSDIEDPNYSKETMLEELAEGFADLIDNYYKTGTILITPEKVVLAVLSNSGGPVIAANNLIGTIE